MSPRFRPSDIDEVRQRADIVEVIGEYVRLRRAGRAYKGLCPFHQEKTPSFTVDRDKGVYYCFGCRASGTVFRFLEQVENLTFSEAVEQLARRYGVELREASSPQRRVSPRARLQALHEQAVAHYRRLLEGTDGEAPRAYLAERGIGEAARRRYSLGFGGWSPSELVRAMLRAGFSGEELLTSGLAVREGRGMRDRFWGRVLFPVFDPAGRPIGFGGRVLPEAYRRGGAPEAPKYLNSPESPLFHKSRVLYGINWARGEVAAARRVVVVEGYTDVIALHGAGVGEAVATCGTALTEEHMRLLSQRFGDVRVVLCLDADAAGQAAAARAGAGELADAFTPGEAVDGGWLPVGRGWLPEVWVAVLPAGQDPADFARSGGEEAVRRALEAAAPLVEFLLRYLLAEADLSGPEGRARAVHRGAEVLARVGDPLLRHEYALWLADRAGVEPYEVKRAVESRARPGPRRARRAEAAPLLSGPHRVEREALRGLVAHPALLAAGVGEEQFTLPVHRAALRLLRAEWEERGAVDAASLADRVQDEDLRRVVAELVVSDGPSEAAARETLDRLKEFALGRQIEQCKARLRQLDPEREAAAYDRLFEELLRLERERRSIRSA